METSSNVIPVGGTGTGKTHLAISMARQAIKIGKRGRYFNVVDLVNQLKQEKLVGRGGKLAESLCRLDLVVLDELGYLPFSKNGGQLLFHPSPKLYMKMPFNLFPDVDRPQITVITVMPGGAAGDVETDITRLIEKEVATIDMVRKVTSTSKDEASVVRPELHPRRHVNGSQHDARGSAKQNCACQPMGRNHIQLCTCRAKTDNRFAALYPHKDGL